MPQCNWSELVLRHNWSELVLQCNWSELVLRHNWSELLVQHNWSELLVQHNWSELLPGDNSSALTGLGSWSEGQWRTGCEGQTVGSFYFQRASSCCGSSGVQPAQSYGQRTLHILDIRKISLSGEMFEAHQNAGSASWRRRNSCARCSSSWHAPSGAGGHLSWGRRLRRLSATHWGLPQQGGPEGQGAMRGRRLSS